MAEKALHMKHQNRGFTKHILTYIFEELLIKD